MLVSRRIDIPRYRKILLDSHCRTNYEVESPWARSVPYEQYRDWWASTNRPHEFLEDLQEWLEDERTIAEIWEDDDSVVGYVITKFTDLQHSGITIAEISDILVTPDYRRRGIALMLMSRVEEPSRERDAHILRSGTWIESLASQNLHAKAGFQIRRFEYEKVLRIPLTFQI